MLKKRLVGVVTVKDGWAVQSFGFKRYLPLGKPEILVENLDRWGADEILIQCIDRSRKALGPDFKLLERIAARGIGTPIIYGGGIRHLQDAITAVSLGADRISLDALLHDKTKSIEALSAQLGAQALIAALPMSIANDRAQWFNYREGTSAELPDRLLRLFRDRVVSEALIVDWKHEGAKSAFDMRLAERHGIPETPLIVFGGISESAQIVHALKIPQVTAVAVGNFLNYRENAVAELKFALATLPVRLPSRPRGLI